MFDAIINFISVSNRFEKYEREKLIKRSFLKGVQKFFVPKKNSKTLKVIIPPWGDSEYYVTKLLKKRLASQGFACLSYSFPQNILSADAENVPLKFQLVREKVLADIEKLKKRYGFLEIDLIGTSLGVVTACLIANNSKHFKDIFFIVPGNCAASSLWDGIRTQKLALAYQNQGLSKDGLARLWQELAPENNIDNLSFNNLYVATSKSDRIIPYCYGKKLTDQLQKRYKKVHIMENNRLGHYLTVLKYFLFSDLLYK